MKAFHWMVSLLPAIILFADLASTAIAQVKVDSKLPDYKATGGVSGNIKSVGSDTMNNLMTLRAEQFNRVYPNVPVEIEGKGSSTAPPALIAGAANWAAPVWDCPSSSISPNPTAAESRCKAWWGRDRYSPSICRSERIDHRTLEG